MHAYVDTILDALEVEAQERSKKRKQSLKDNGVQSNDAVVDGAVKFDGTWARLNFPDWSFLCAVGGHWRISQLSCPVTRVTIILMMNLKSGK